MQSTTVCKIQLLLLWKHFTFKFSPLKPYLVEMILGLFPIKNYLSIAALLSVRMTYKFKLKVHDVESFIIYS